MEPDRRLSEVGMVLAQAQGILMARYDVDSLEAVRRLSELAESEGLSRHDVAWLLVTDVERRARVC